MTRVPLFLPLCFAGVRVCLSDCTLQSALSSAQLVCPLRGLGGVARESGMPWLFEKCQCGDSAIAVARFACV